MSKLQCHSHGRHLSLAGAPIAVGAQHGDTTPYHLRPHHRCVGDTALAARPRMRAVQDRGPDVRSTARQRAAITGTSCRRR